MVPPDSDQISRGRSYSGTQRALFSFRWRGYHPVSLTFSGYSAKIIDTHVSGPTTPRIRNSWFGLFPLRSPLLWESLLDFFSSAYWDVSLRLVSLCRLMNSDNNNGTLLPLGSPIRTFPDQCFFPAPRNLSQVCASFIAYRCQGIHQQLLATWSNFWKLLFRRKINIVNYPQALIYISENCAWI